MPLSLQIILLVVAAYLIGGIPMGLLVARLKGVDIRKHGSGNIGATNVGRVIGPYFGVLVLVLDVMKGASTSLAASWYLTNGLAAAEWSQGYAADLVRTAAAIACVTGNTASLFLGFKGGKGVATALGVLLGIYPYLTWPVLICGALWLAVVGWTRYVSVGSLAGAATLPPVFIGSAYYFNWTMAMHWPLLALTIVLSLIVIVRHRGNIGRLRAGTESHMGAASAAVSAGENA